MVMKILKRDKRNDQDGRKGASGCSLLAGGFSLGKGRGTMGFWLGDEGLGSPLVFFLAVGTEGEQMGAAAAAGRLYWHWRVQPLYCPSLVMGEPLLVRVAIELGPFQHPTSLRRTLTLTLFRCTRGKTRTPNPVPCMEGASPGCFWQLPAAAFYHHPTLLQGCLLHFVRNKAHSSKFLKV